MLWSIFYWWINDLRLGIIIHWYRNEVFHYLFPEGMTCLINTAHSRACLGAQTIFPSFPHAASCPANLGQGAQNQFKQTRGSSLCLLHVCYLFFYVSQVTISIFTSLMPVNASFPPWFDSFFLSCNHLWTIIPTVCEPSS